MNFSTYWKVFVVRQRMRGREYWIRERLVKLQQRQLQKLRDYAYKHSSFYQTFHRGLEQAPLSSLPVLSKAQTMDNFDEIVTDKNIRFAALCEHIKHAQPGMLFRDKYRVITTSGSTGEPGVFVFDPWSWAHIIGMEKRLLDFAHAKDRLSKDYRVACITSSLPWHQSWQIAHTFTSKLRNDYLYLSAQEPMPLLVEKLNRFQPDSLISYANVIHQLAQEALNNKLKISPKQIYCGGEALTDDMAARIENAWQERPFNLYGLTEAGNIASDCILRRGMHINDDLVIVENVDDSNQSVPVGKVGSKILLTVLFNHVMPLIRYEISDRIVLSDEVCPCKKTFRVIATVDGRVEDSLILEDLDGKPCSLHPNFFHALFDVDTIRAWQLIEDDQGLTVRVIPHSSSSLVQNGLKQKLTDALVGANVKLPLIRIETAQELIKGKTGKTKLIMAKPK